MELAWKTWARKGPRRGLLLVRVSILKALPASSARQTSTGPAQIQLENVLDLRQQFQLAVASGAGASMYLQPGVVFRLGGEPFTISTPVDRTLINSYEGATLDPEELSRVFEVEYGCCLTLRRLNPLKRKCQEVCSRHLQPDRIVQRDRLRARHFHRQAFASICTSARRASTMT